MENREINVTTDENERQLEQHGIAPFPIAFYQGDLRSNTVVWHWHEELEFDYAYKGSIVIETVNKTYTIRQGEAYFINTNIMNTKRRASDSTVSIEHAHLFHPLLLAGHYKSVFETKYMNPVLKNLSLEVLIIREDTRSGKEFLKILSRLIAKLRYASPRCNIFYFRDL